MPPEIYDGPLDIARDEWNYVKEGPQNWIKFI